MIRRGLRWPSKKKVLINRYLAFTRKILGKADWATSPVSSHKPSNFNRPAVHTVIQCSRGFQSCRRRIGGHGHDIGCVEVWCFSRRNTLTLKNLGFTHPSRPVDQGLWIAYKPVTRTGYMSFNLNMLQPSNCRVDGCPTALVRTLVKDLNQPLKPVRCKVIVSMSLRRPFSRSNSRFFLTNGSLFIRTFKTFSKAFYGLAVSLSM